MLSPLPPLSGHSASTLSILPSPSESRSFCSHRPARADPHRTRHCCPAAVASSASSFVAGSSSTTTTTTTTTNAPHSRPLFSSTTRFSALRILRAMSQEKAERADKATVLDSAFLDPTRGRSDEEDANDAVAGNVDLDLDDDLDAPVLIVLNHNLPRLTAALWSRARLVLVADGGANRLLEAAKGWEKEEEELGKRGKQRRRQQQRSDDDDDDDDDDDGRGKDKGKNQPFLPDAIVGDLDSISEEARAYYNDRGVRVVDLSRDQDSTDLQKCLAFAAAEVEKEASSSSSLSPPPVFVAGALGGRLDHSLSAISTLYAIDAARSRGRGGGGEERNEGSGFAAAAARSLGEIVLCGDGSLARLVPSSSSSSSSSSVVKIIPCAAVEGPGCGLVALGLPAKEVETSGLKWNLEKRGEEEKNSEPPPPPLEMGGVQSTSNSIEGEEVTVRASAPLLWTTTLREEWS